MKIANHGPGREMSPESPKRAVTPEDEKNLREFLSSTFPALADAPMVYSRVCMYCDTHDGNFWIARDPDRRGLIIAAGDCGHGFKFAPVLGEIIADAVEENQSDPAKIPLATRRARGKRDGCRTTQSGTVAAVCDRRGEHADELEFRRSQSAATVKLGS
jgi:glycine/D-amino acid oxidase-like deaminating enzyme